MRHLIFTQQEQETYPIALFAATLRRDDLKRAFLDGSRLKPEDVVAIGLEYTPGKKKSPVKDMRAFLDEVAYPVLRQAKTEYLIVTDADYFKAITKLPKAEPYIGYVMESDGGEFKVVYSPSARQVFYDPVKIKGKIAQSLNALCDHREGTYQEPGTGIIQHAEYLYTYQEIEEALQALLDMDAPLTIDIEAFDLKHYRAGIGTITFCWSQHEGIAFPVDYSPYPDAVEAPFGRQVRNEPIRRLLRWFFANYKKKAIYHNAAFDCSVLIYQLYMKNLLDTAGMLEGMKIMLANWHCTKLIAYLATNSCAGNKLSLKEQAQEFAGNWAVEEIEDITKIPLPKLLEYNLVDGLSTWFTFNKRYPGMVADQQEPVYDDLFQPATVDIIQMQLTGMPVNMQRVGEVRVLLEKDHQKAMGDIQSNPLVQAFTYQMNEDWVLHKNTTLKKKRVTLADAKEVFNPNSDPQLRKLLYEVIGLPVISLTDSKVPGTGGDVLKALRNHTTDQGVIDLLNALIDFSAVDKIVTSFLPALEGAEQGPDGWYYLFGNFNLGGTVSGRLSSSKPNLQNLPANSKYAKLIKSCFQAPPGWLFVGLDFASLEDRISALTTKDPNKLKVYTDGYDGHCLRAYAYFPEEMPDIDPNDVASINSIEKLHKTLRQDSKAPTFALTYQGTYITLMTNCGFSKAKAMLVEQRYKDLYAHSIEWVQQKLNQASIDGYVTVAFGLRVRTPLLYQVVRGLSKTPFEAEAEGRTAGNALGQSWCLLNSRAGSEFMSKVRTSEHRLNIRPCSQIHDASYYLIRDDMAAVLYTNEHLVKAVQWQDHPDIYHDEVKLGGDLSIFYPTWNDEMVIPNGATAEVVEEAIAAHIEKLAA